MSLEEFIITVYCLLRDLYKDVVESRLRKRGPEPALTDCEALTIVVVGEYLGLGSDKKIWSYFKMHWGKWFPNLQGRTSFGRQISNLYGVLKVIQEKISSTLCPNSGLFIFDGFPIPTRNIKRYNQSGNFKGEGAVGYCAAKDEKYFGFKGHLAMSSTGVIKAISVAAANIDERDVVPETVYRLFGDLLADKGLIRPELTKLLAEQGLSLHTPLRKNMKETRPQKFIQWMCRARRKVETVIGQLVERFKIQAIRAKDMWHLMAKVTRKVFSHTLCMKISNDMNQADPLQLEGLVAA